tara:strand:+ start:2667 stop:2894 length:228 start_codon:yes stop_codon:yes gene_type:complete
MSLSSILLLALVILTGIYSYSLLALNQTIVSIDLLFFELDFEIGKIILISFLIGILVTIFLEVLFFSSKKRKEDE